MVIMVEETRYWPRLGLRVTKKVALEAAERMGGQASFYDDEMEEFVMTDNLPTDAQSEVERLFDAPDTTDENADSTHTVILKTMELHTQRRAKVIQYRKDLKDFTIDDEEAYVQELVENGYTPEKANEELVLETKRQKDAEVNRLYTEWLDEKVIALQKEHGIYKESQVIEIEMNETEEEEE
jgi:hypothetical protein